MRTNICLTICFFGRIIFEAGYFTDNDVFMRNIGTILVNAVAGTIFNTFAIGYTMYGISAALGLGLEPAQGLVFGALIAAVDPVAVLTIFESQHINAQLHMIVSGESILNDGVAIVLYRICVALAYSQSLETGAFWR